MFELLNKSLTLNDRQSFDIYINEDLTGAGSYFIMSLDSKFASKNITATGCFAGYTHQEFSLSGKYIALKLDYFNFGKTIISDIPWNNPGDLSYIDGCSNSVIIPPPRNGEPCINYLYFPKNINQTPHTHPSVRIGLVLSGQGYAILGKKKKPLKQGDIFLLDRHTLHNFATTHSDMSLIVFHPDSESGPTDEFNPMISRTYLK